MQCVQSAHEDAQTIRNAIKGLGTDDAKLVGVITQRSNEQLITITNDYIVCVTISSVFHLELT